MIVIGRLQVYEPSIAEEMIDIAISTLYPKGQIKNVDSKICPMLDIDSARIVTSLKFYSMDAGFKFRAIYERWDGARINREMY